MQMKKTKCPVYPVQIQETFFLLTSVFQDKVYWTLSTCGAPEVDDGSLGDIGETGRVQRDRGRRLMTGYSYIQSAGSRYFALIRIRVFQSDPDPANAKDWIRICSSRWIGSGFGLNTIIKTVLSVNCNVYYQKTN